MSPRDEIRATAIPKVNLVLRSGDEAVRELSPWIDRWRLQLGDPDTRGRLDELWAWCQESRAPLPVTKAHPDESRESVSIGLSGA